MAERVDETVAISILQAAVISIMKVYIEYILFIDDIYICCVGIDLAVDNAISGRVIGNWHVGHFDIIECDASPVDTCTHRQREERAITIDLYLSRADRSTTSIFITSQPDALYMDV
jgi:hypothetical protein